MYSRVNYTVVGFFVLLFGISAVVFAFWLGKYRLEAKWNIYRIEMRESMSGLSKDSSVKFHGVTIGRVTKIHINPQNIGVVDIFMEIEDGIPLKEDMLASTQMLGITGLLFIEIAGGTNESKTLNPTKNYIPLIKSKPSLLSTFTDNVGGVGEKVNILLSQGQKLFTDTNIEKLTQILDNVEKITQKAETLEDKLIVSLEGFDNTLGDLNHSMQTLNTNIRQATSDFRVMRDAFGEIKEVTVPMVTNVAKTSTDFKRVILQMEKTIKRGDYNFKKMLEPILVDMQILTQQMSDFSRDFGDNPSMVLKSRKIRKGPGE